MPSILQRIKAWTFHTGARIISPWMMKIDADGQNGLSKASAADALQIRSVSQQRLVQKIGTLSSVQVAKIVQAVMTVLQR